MGNGIFILYSDPWMSGCKRAQTILKVMQLRKKFGNQLGFKTSPLFTVNNINMHHQFLNERFTGIAIFRIPIGRILGMLHYLGVWSQ
jgi:hypothetical protein